jgi:hypothetical protein
MQLGAGLQILSARELLEGLRLAVLEDFEIFSSKVGQVLPTAVCHRRGDADELGTGAKCGLLCAQMGERCGQDYRAHSDYTPGHATF